MESAHLAVEYIEEVGLATVQIRANDTFVFVGKGMYNPVGHCHSHSSGLIRTDKDRDKVFTRGAGFNLHPVVLLEHSLTS